MADHSNNKIWTTEEIIENADNWSLAGDVALLNSIKAFSDRLLDQTVKISGNVDNLLNNLNDVSLKLDLTKNKFQSLRNTQFIESRVYEDDETLDSTEENSNKFVDKPLSEEEKDKIIKESIMRGLQVMENYFDKVEVSVSDSEEESEKSYILQPKDLYADRPLPFLIGSEEWYKKWHVGLLQSSSESESEKEVEEAFSDSESEDYLPKDTVFGSETSSELSFANTQNSTFHDPVAQRKRDEFPSSDSTSSDYTNSFPPTKAPFSNQQFVDQLSEKLGSVVNDQENNTLPVNKNPIKNITNSNKFGGLFSDEPPPLDDFSETASIKNSNSGLFSGGTNLFDKEDEDDHLLWGQQSKIEENRNKSEAEVDGNRQSQNKKHKDVITSKTSQLSRGLFDSGSSSSEEDIFSSSKKQQTAKPYLQPFVTPSTVPMFDDKPPELEPPKRVADNVSSKKKPIGGVSIFGNADIFTGKKPILDRSQKETSPSDKTSDTVSASSDIKTSNKKITNLFDESSDEDEFRPNLPTTNKPKPLFDSDTESEKQRINTNTEKSSQYIDVTSVKNKTLNLFDESDDETNYSTLNTTVPTVKDIDKHNIKDESSAVSKEPQFPTKSSATTKKISLFDDDDDIFKSDYDDIFSVDANITKKFTSSLFDDLEQSGDSKIFGSTSSKSLSKSGEKKVTNQNDNKDKQKIKKKVSLFDNSSSEEEGGKLESEIFRQERQQKEILAIKTEEVDDQKFLKKDYKETVEVIKSIKDGDKDQRVENAIKPSKTKIKDEENVLKKEPDQDALSETSKTEISVELPKALLNEKNVVDNSIKEEEKNVGIVSKPEVSVPDKDGVEVEKPEVKITAPTPKSDVSITPKPQVPIRPLNLFDPTPPPVDDWDTKSDNISDIDDPYDRSYVDDISNNQGSSIFDNEPPFLSTNNESSGIGVDQNMTRVETDDSSFDPCASSSRRLSSDIFSDQQSNDSFFITKNKTETLPTRNLQSIPESTTSSSASALNITPSGDVVDFLYSSSSFESSVFESNKDSSQPESSVHKPNQLAKKKISLFDSDPEESNDVDDFLFASNVKQTSKPPTKYESGDVCKDVATKFRSGVGSEKQSDTNQISQALPMNESGDGLKDVNTQFQGEDSSGKQSDSDTIEDSKEKGVESGDAEYTQSGTGKSEPIQEDTIQENQVPSKSVSTSKVSGLAEKIQSTSKESVTKEVKLIGSPGKLKHNLNINVNALMPGLRPPKLRNTAKSRSLDAGKDNEPELSSTSSSDISLISPHSSSTSVSHAQERPVSFDKGTDVEVLQSVTKDRVKIPIKRRPSTRKARQENIKRSVPDEHLYGDVDNNESSVTTESASVTVTREEQYVGEKMHTSEKDVITIKTKVDSKLLGDDTDLFGRKTAKPEKEEIIEQLFASEQMDTVAEDTIKSTDKDTLKSFSDGVKTNLLEENTKNNPKEQLIDQPTKYGKPNNSDDDTDLFGASVVKKSKITNPKSKPSLFSDSPESDDESLFGGKKAATSKKVAEKKKSLFGDDGSSDDDLFGTGGSTGENRKKGLITKPVERKHFKTSVVKKLHNTETDDDPLSSLFK